MGGFVQKEAGLEPIGKMRQWKKSITYSNLRSKTFFTSF